MAWLTGYRFSEAFIDLRRNDGRADVLAAELRREIGPEHPLTSRVWTLIAEAVAQDEVVLALDGDGVALVHLTWRRATEPAPFPATVIVASRAEFEALVENRY
ncbi:MAG: hypothetical protein QM695_00795 [Micropruina sp.]